MTAVSVQVVEGLWSRPGRSPLLRRLTVAGAAMAALLALAALYKAEAVARLDGRVVVKLSAAQGQVLSELMTRITTMGDLIPTFTMAIVLAWVIFRLGHHTIACALLPLILLAEIAVQIAITDIFRTRPSAMCSQRWSSVASAPYPPGQ